MVEKTPSETEHLEQADVWACGSQRWFEHTLTLLYVLYGFFFFFVAPLAAHSNKRKPSDVSNGVSLWAYSPSCKTAPITPLCSPAPFSASL